MTEGGTHGHLPVEMSSAVVGIGLGWPFVAASDSVGATTEPRRIIEPRAQEAETSFEEIYDEYFEFVWRSVRRLGVAESQLDDAVQDVFLVVHRRLSDFEGRSSVRTWLFGIALRVARGHRRRAARKGTEPLMHEVIDPHGRRPDDETARNQGLRLVYQLLDELDDDKRAVFVSAELEQMTAPEIADALGVKLNTVYSRLRAARKNFEEALKRHHARTRTRA